MSQSFVWRWIMATKFCLSVDPFIRQLIHKKISERSGIISWVCVGKDLIWVSQRRSKDVLRCISGDSQKEWSWYMQQASILNDVAVNSIQNRLFIRWGMWKTFLKKSDARLPLHTYMLLYGKEWVTNVCMLGDALLPCIAYWFIGLHFTCVFVFMDEITLWKFPWRCSMFGRLFWLFLTERVVIPVSNTWNREQRRITPPMN